MYCNRRNEISNRSHSFHSISDSKSELNTKCILHTQVRLRSNRCPLCAAAKAKKQCRTGLGNGVATANTHGASVTASCRGEKENSLSGTILNNSTEDILTDAGEDGIEKVSLHPKWAEALREISIRLANKKAEQVCKSPAPDPPNDEKDDVSLSSFETHNFRKIFAESKEQLPRLGFSNAHHRQGVHSPLSQRLELLSKATDFGTDITFLESVNLCHSLGSESLATLSLACGHTEESCFSSVATRMPHSPLTSSSASHGANSPISVMNAKALSPDHNHDDKSLQEEDVNSDYLEKSSFMAIPKTYSEVKTANPVTPTSTAGQSSSPESLLARQKSSSSTVDQLDDNSCNKTKFNNRIESPTDDSVDEEITARSSPTKAVVKSPAKAHPSFFCALVNNSRCRSRTPSSRSKSRSRYHVGVDETERRCHGEKGSEHAKELGHSPPPQAQTAKLPPQSEQCKPDPQTEPQPVVAETPEKAAYRNESRGSREPFTHPLYKLGDLARDEDMIVFSVTRRRRSRRQWCKRDKSKKNTDSLSSDDSDNEDSHCNRTQQAISELRHLDAAFGEFELFVSFAYVVSFEYF